MAVTRVCPRCGSEAGETAYCSTCGLNLWEEPELPTREEWEQTSKSTRPGAARAQTPTGQEPRDPPPPPATERLSELTPGATELAEAVARQVRTPVVLLPLASGVIGAAVMIVAGVVLQAILPHSSGASLYGNTNISLATAGLDEACGFTLANFALTGHSATIGPPAPMLFLVFPLVGCGIPAFLLARRDTSLSSWALTLSGFATGLPFALLMLIPALAAGKTSFTIAQLTSLQFEPAVGAVFGLSLLWGALAGGVGAGLGARRRGLAPSGRRLPAWAAPAGNSAWASLRALLVALVAMVVIGTVATEIQVLRNAGHLTSFSGESKATETLDTVLGIANTGVNYTDLSGAVAFHNPPRNNPSDLVLPVARPGAVTGSSDDAPRTPAPSGTYRIFDYRDALPIWAFIMLLALMVIPVVLALYGGFLLARSARTRTPGLGAALGAVQGLIWGTAMVLLSIPQRPHLGDLVLGGPAGDSVFVLFLLGGAVLGALGGFLATQSTAKIGAPPPPAQRG